LPNQRKKNINWIYALHEEVCGNCGKTRATKSQIENKSDLEQDFLEVQENKDL
jgi:hypothetical protein